MTLADWEAIAVVLSIIGGAAAVLYRMGRDAGTIGEKIDELNEAQGRTTSEVESVRGDLVRVTSELHSIGKLLSVVEVTQRDHNNRITRLEGHIDDMRRKP